MSNADGLMPDPMPMLVTAENAVPLSVESASGSLNRLMMGKPGTKKSAFAITITFVALVHSTSAKS